MRRPPASSILTSGTISSALLPSDMAYTDVSNTCTAAPQTINAPSGYSGTLFTLEVNGTSKLAVDQAGNITVPNTAAFISGATSRTSISQGLISMISGSNHFQMGGNMPTLSTWLSFDSDGPSTHALAASIGTQTFLKVDTPINQSGTACYTALVVNDTETATGSGTKYRTTGGRWRRGRARWTR